MINLLPWRERLREERKRNFLISAGVASISAMLIMLMMHLYFVNKIDAQRSRNMLLESEISILDRKIYMVSQIQKEKERLQIRMNIIQELQQSRPDIVHIFDEIYKVVPTSIYLTSVDRVGDLITFKGVAQSNSDVSALMRNIEISHWLSHAVLSNIKSEKVADLTQYNFEVSCHIKSTNNNLDHKEGLIHAKQS